MKDAVYFASCKGLDYIVMPSVLPVEDIGKVGQV
jgi:hypothetical protein